MIDDKKVVVFTPWGREITASILFKYIERDYVAGIVDEWHLWMNTDDDQLSDRRYGYGLAANHDWIKTFERPPGEVLKPKQMNTGRFYVYTQDPDTIYVRMDDDIVWIEPNAIKRLVKHRIDNPFPFIVFPIIWNNAVCSHYLQTFGKISKEWGEVGNYCMDWNGWGNVQLAEGIHNQLLKAIEEDKIEDLFLHHSIQLPPGHQFSVSCFAQFGEEYRKVNGFLGNEEEGWHTMSKPYELSRPNVIIPNSLVSHFSFYHQREYLLQTDLLERYRKLADDVY
jgi:hypothetical protein